MWTEVILRKLKRNSKETFSQILGNLFIIKKKKNWYNYEVLRNFRKISRKFRIDFVRILQSWWKNGKILGEFWNEIEKSLNKLLKKFSGNLKKILRMLDSFKWRTDFSFHKYLHTIGWRLLSWRCREVGHEVQQVPRWTRWLRRKIVYTLSYAIEFFGNFWRCFSI